MQFGFVPRNELLKNDFELPGESPLNEKVFPKKIEEGKEKKLLLGNATWGNKGWIGKTFSYGTTEKEYLVQYAKHFNCVEFNNSYKNDLSKRTISHIAEKTHGRNFWYFPKLNKKFTDGKFNLDSQYKKEFETFIDCLQGFGYQLGGIIIEFDEKFSSTHFTALESFTEYLSGFKNNQFFIELKHASWYENSSSFQNLQQLFIENGIGLVILDTPGRREIVHTALTIPKVLIKFSGYGKDASDKIRLSRWKEKIIDWYRKGICEVVFMFHLEDEIYFPEIGRYFIESINGEYKVGHRMPRVNTSIYETKTDRFKHFIRLLFNK